MLGEAAGFYLLPACSDNPTFIDTERDRAPLLGACSLPLRFSAAPASCLAPKEQGRSREHPEVGIWGLWGGSAAPPKHLP